MQILTAVLLKGIASARSLTNFSLLPKLAKSAYDRLARDTRGSNLQYELALESCFGSTCHFHVSQRLRRFRCQFDIFFGHLFVCERNDLWIADVIPSGCPAWHILSD
jgi:hypothetical protein